jgi:hypothetical protein
LCPGSGRIAETIHVGEVPLATKTAEGDVDETESFSGVGYSVAADDSGVAIVMLTT